MKMNITTQKLKQIRNTIENMKSDLATIKHVRKKLYLFLKQDTTIYEFSNESVNNLKQSRSEHNINLNRNDEKQGRNLNTNSYNYDYKDVNNFPIIKEHFTQSYDDINVDYNSNRYVSNYNNKQIQNENAKINENLAYNNSQLNSNHQLLAISKEIEELNKYNELYEKEKNNIEVFNRENNDRTRSKDKIIFNYDYKKIENVEQLNPLLTDKDIHDLINSNNSNFLEREHIKDYNSFGVLDFNKGASLANTFNKLTQNTGSNINYKEDNSHINLDNYYKIPDKVHENYYGREFSHKEVIEKENKLIDRLNSCVSSLI